MLKHLILNKKNKLNSVLNNSEEFKVADKLSFINFNTTDLSLKICCFSYITILVKIILICNKIHKLNFTFHSFKNYLLLNLIMHFRFNCCDDYHNLL